MPVGQCLDGLLEEDLRLQPSQVHADLTWRDVAALRDRWDGPVLIKGILDPADAVTAIDDVGATGVIVSNHGGRQCNAVMASLVALPGVADAIGDRAEVLLDGGIRCGTDVVTALALGADAVMIGRPYLYGLAVAGRAGVADVLVLLAEETRKTLLLMGVGAVTDPGRDHALRQPDEM